MRRIITWYRVISGKETSQHSTQGKRCLHGHFGLTDGHTVIAGASEEDEAFVHSFHLDLRQNPEHRALLDGVSAALQKTLGRVAEHVSAWRSLDALWITDKAADVEQLKVLCQHTLPAF